MLQTLKSVNSDLFLPEYGQNRGTNCDQCYFFGNSSGSDFVRLSLKQFKNQILNLKMTF